MLALDRHGSLPSCFFRGLKHSLPFDTFWDLWLPFVLLLATKKMRGSGRSDIVISAVDALDICITLARNDCDKYPGS